MAKEYLPKKTFFSLKITIFVATSFDAIKDKINTMKVILKIALTLAAIILVDASACADNRDWAALGRYAADNKALPPPGKDEHRVVFMGNSITYFWVDKHSHFFTSNNYIGRGISGQTSSQFLLRFREDVINLSPEIVIINAGTNDCAENTGPFNVDITLGNIISMVELAQANGIKVILSSVLPVAEFYWNRSITDVADRVAILNDRIKSYAVSKGLPYIDYYTKMVDGPDRALNPLYTDDGVHPNELGYEIMESIVKPAIDSIIEMQ